MQISYTWQRPAPLCQPRKNSEISCRYTSAIVDRSICNVFTVGRSALYGLVFWQTRDLLPISDRIILDTTVCTYPRAEDFECVEGAEDVNRIDCLVTVRVSRVPSTSIRFQAMNTNVGLDNGMCLLAVGFF
jgi:hypothetical protein